MPDFTIPLLLIVAALLGVVLYLSRIERALRWLANRESPESPDLAPAFIDLQERIESDGEATRRKVREEARELYTDLTAAIRDTAAEVRADAKKTRKDIQEVKTALRDEEKDDQRAKAAARRLAKKLEDGAELIVEAGPTLPEGTMVLRDEETGDEVTLSGVTVDDIEKAARKAASTKKKPKASK